MECGRRSLSPHTLHPHISRRPPILRDAGVLSGTETHLLCENTVRSTYRDTRASCLFSPCTRGGPRRVWRVNTASTHVLTPHLLCQHPLCLHPSACVNTSPQPFHAKAAVLAIGGEYLESLRSETRIHRRCTGSLADAP
eukprot:6651560-Prymnesium_polylepis.1